MKGIRLLSWSIFALLLLAGCERTFDPVPEHLSDVFPLDQGKHRIYHVSDSIWASVNGVEGRTYFRKEVNDGTETDLLGREVTKLFLYDSPDSLDSLGNPVYSWTYSTLWTQFSDENFAERSEENIRFLVLKNPPVAGSEWNGNLYNSEDPETFEVLNDDTTVVVRGVTYEHCVFVEQIPYRRPVQMPGGPFFLEEYAYEIYAPGIGKIVRYHKFFESQGPAVDEDSRVYYEELVTHNFD